MTEEQQIERLYVGGMEPPRLKPSEVVERLRLLDGIEIKSVDADDKKSFIHLNALSLEQNYSAFEIISKSYNNVKWKGCKLKIQIAKPPLLQRLEQERQEREKREVKALQNPTIDPAMISSPTLPRHLRIRQGFGLEAWRVDTKPCETMDWDTFNKILTQLRKRRERKTRNVKDSKTKAFYSRGVHLLFNDKEKNIDIKMSKQNKEQLDDPESSTQTDADTSESEEDNHLDNGNNKVEYEWSSNDDSTEENSLIQDEESQKTDSTVASECAGDNGTTYEKPQQEKLDMDKMSIDIVSKKDNNNDVKEKDNTMKVGGVESNITTATEQNPSYAWSSDEESSNSEQTEDSSPKQSNSIEDDSNVDDLENDVATNLGILGHLFPEMKDVTPNQIEKNTEDGSNKSTWNIDNMKRYDPTKDTAQLYEVNNEQDENSFSKIGHDDEDSETSNNSSDDDSKTSDKSLSKGKNITEDSDEGAKHVYHESKLEEVFRTARNSGEGGGFQVSSIFGDQPEELKKQELVNEDEKDDKEGSFSFAFDLPSVSAKTDVKAANNNNLVECGDSQVPEAIGRAEKEDSSGRDEESTPLNLENPVVQPNRQRGFMPPDRILDHYYKKFFELSSEKFRTDEAVKQKWDEERKALTQDYKRKRKYAQVRMQRNNKFRR